jgi:ferredoxin
MIFRVDENKCTVCGICMEVCPVEAITIDRVAKIDTQICIGCGSCVAQCPNEAILMEKTENKLSYRKSAIPQFHGSAKRNMVTPFSLRISRQQPSYAQANEGSKFSEQVSEFFRKTENPVRGKRYGAGRGRGGGKGRGSRNRR